MLLTGCSKGVGGTAAVEWGGAVVAEWASDAGCNRSAAAAGGSGGAGVHVRMDVALCMMEVAVSMRARGGSIGF